MQKNINDSDSKSSYSVDEVNKIKNILNVKYFLYTPFVCNELKIYKNDEYFFKNSNDPHSLFCFEIDCVVTKNGKKTEVLITPITQKVESQQVAHHIAHEVWLKLDGTNTSQLWNNFEPKTK